MIETKIVPELFEQVDRATNNYYETMEELDLKISKIEPEEVLDNWLNFSKLSFLRAVRQNDPESNFILVYSPNEDLNVEELRIIAKSYKGARSIKSEPELDETILGKYPSQQLSGYNNNQQAPRISVIPSTSYIDNIRSYQESKDEIESICHKNPFLKIPSVQDSLIYWKNILGEKNEIVDPYAKLISEIVHLDLDPVKIKDQEVVPHSSLNIVGQGKIGSIELKNIQRIRLAVI